MKRIILIALLVLALACTPAGTPTPVPIPTPNQEMLMPWRFTTGEGTLEERIVELEKRLDLLEWYSARESFYDSLEPDESVIREYPPYTWP